MPLKHPTTRAEAIAREIRSKVISGQWQPGHQLPSWDDLSKYYGVTRTTLNRIFDRLKSSGFVYSASTRGTFVVDRPPHLYRYGLAFNSQPGMPGWNRFWDTLAAEAGNTGKAMDKEISLFFGVDSHEDNETLRHLWSQVTSDRLAGLMLIGERATLPEDFWEYPTLPKVGIWEPSPQRPPPSVYIDYHDFVDRALDFMAARGRKRVALISVPDVDLSHFAKAAADRQMFHPPHWSLIAPAQWPHAARSIVQLLMSLPAGERPDALVIADDNLVEQSVAALMNLGVRIPDELEVVAYSNWPQPVPSPLPLRRLGFDVRQVLRSAVELIDAQRRGETIAAHTPVRAMFEEDVAY